MNENIDLNIMVRLFLIDKLFQKPNEVKRIFLASNYDIIVSKDELKLIEEPRNQPKKALYIRALLDLGYSPKTVSDWLGASIAAVSYHKLSDREYTYINHFLKAKRDRAYEFHRKSIGLQD